MAMMEPDMLNADVARRRDDAISRGVGMMTQIYADRALNSEIWDIEGNRYIDFARRHRGGQHRALPPQGHGSGDRADEPLHPHLPSGPAL